MKRSIKVLLSITLLTVIFSANIFAQEKAKLAPQFSVWVNSYMSNDFTEGKAVPNNFGLKYARIIAKGNIVDNVGYHLMGDFAYGAKLTQAWVCYAPIKYAKFRFGQFKYPFGAEAYASILKWKFINPSYATLGITKKLGTEGSMFRDIGIQVAGQVTASKEISFFYKAMVMNGNGANVVDNNNNKDYVANLGVKLPMNITVAGSYYTGSTNDNAGDVAESGLSVYAMMQGKRFSAQVEYISASNKFINSTIKPAGYYAYATYKVLSKLEVGVRYDAFDRNSDDEIDNSQSRISLQSGWYFNKVNRVMLNYEIRNDDKNKDLGNLLTLFFQVAI